MPVPQPKPRRTWQRWAWGWLRRAAVMYLLVCLGMCWLETSMVYPAPRYPDPEGAWTPKAVSSPEDVFLTAADGVKLHAWYVAPPQPRAYMLYCHGNGENVATLDKYLAMLRDRFQLAVLALDYRGYGKSEGRPHERGLLLDAEAALDWLADRAGQPKSQLLLMGRSLGGGVVVQMAARHGARALIVENTFPSLPEVGAYHFPWLPVSLLMRNRFDSRSAIGTYHGPLLQLHGRDDVTIPIHLGRQLFDAAHEPKTFFEAPGGHNHWPPPEYYEALAKFLDSVLAT